MAKSKRQIKDVTPIEINGEKMFLKYNVFAIRKMEEMGIDLTQFGTDSKVTIEDICKILYCGLLTYDQTLSYDEVCMLIDIDDMEYIADKVMEAMNSVNKSKN